MPADRRIAALALSLASLSAFVASGCGNLPAQDSAEPKGTYAIKLVTASFPSNQKLAKQSNMEIVVENVGPHSVPNVNVTVKCGTALGGSFSTAESESDVADPQRPQFVVDTIPTATPRRPPPLDGAPLEKSSAFVDTYPLGRLAPHRRASFIWKVTAVKAGRYRLCWRVNAGLYGKARAVNPGVGGPVKGEFQGVISNVAPKARVADNGQVIESQGPGTGKKSNSEGQ